MSGSGSSQGEPGGAVSPRSGRVDPMTVAASVRDLTKIYGSGQTEVRALDGVTLDIGAGEFTAVMGPSGSGKSTLMHCCAALDTADSGSVRIGEVELTGLKDKALTALRRDEIGFVFQSFNLVPTLSAKENILLPLAIAGRRPDSAWFDQVVATVGLDDRLGHRPNQLSGGQQQRVAVARALASRPRIVFADEPATSTAGRVPRCSACCAAASTSTSRPSSWSPTTRSRRRTPTAWSSSPTGGSSTSCALPTARPCSRSWRA